MGLDAVVHCRCWAERRATPPPWPEHVKLDDEGVPELDLPYQGHEAQHDEFSQWLASACPHEDMNAARERISNWGGVRLFQQAVARASSGRLPTLEAILPSANGGSVPPETSARALAEIEAFKKLDLGSAVVLADAGTGDELHSFIEVYEGVFLWAGSCGLEAGVDPRGFFIRARDGRELFRAMVFDQRLLEPERTERHEGGDTEFVDRASGARFVAAIEVTGRAIPWPDGRMTDDKGHVRLSHPRHLRVERRAVDASHYAYIIEPLEIVLRASVETGNPMYWQ